MGNVRSYSPSNSFFKSLIPPEAMFRFGTFVSFYGDVFSIAREIAEDDLLRDNTLEYSCHVVLSLSPNICPKHVSTRSTIGGCGDVRTLSPFWEGTRYENSPYRRHI